MGRASGKRFVFALAVPRINQISGDELAQYLFDLDLEFILRRKAKVLAACRNGRGCVVPKGDVDPRKANWLLRVAWGLAFDDQQAGIEQDF